MTKTFALLASAAAVAFAAPVFAADKATYESKTKIEQDASGEYTKKTDEKLKDSSGTTKVETKTDVGTNSNGSTDKTVTTKVVNDPKGLFNKQTTKTKDEVNDKGGNTVVEHKKTVNGKTVEHTKSNDVVGMTGGAMTGAVNNTVTTTTTTH